MELRNWKLSFARTEEWLDRHSAVTHLQDPSLARLVVIALRYFAEQRYDLHAFVVMPSHVHWLFHPRVEWVDTLPNDGRTPRQRITYSINRFTATRCNRLLKGSGPFWQKESYDHWVRDIDELERIIRYIEENPVKAGLTVNPEDWEFSSAYLRKCLHLEWGVPLPGLRETNKDETIGI
jgi:type I restriction enzyme R subunit